jgi:hypothetical protein
MTTDHTTLAAWLPILQLPEVGERICGAAGYHSWGMRPSGDYVLYLGDGSSWIGPKLRPQPLAALAFGTLAVMADDDYPEIIEDKGKWRIGMGEGVGDGDWADTLPAAVLAAALRVWGD